ncbi:iron complex transport system substrate-binding protein [Paracoccus isoporae]|uniref:Iron complex transport system substrate-binding protein n=1 Tax=Paracoccus isoporae TaxID=591205 RepID=A0A1G6TVF6_9RHOB|nr:ABC transporter substrate-binding protein [Paracoccus isoporae]SDD32884.1 iron complex transport system substrate-binding protein [Paracoccus isoporae]
MVRLIAALALCLAGAASAGPSRVVSINLCTDQLAMLVAGPGQLVSVSWLAADPALSLMAEEAGQIGVNHGGAEEIYLMRPDLVLAGPYAAHATVEMLTRLGVQVRTIPAANTIADIRRNITLMGDALGREARAEEILSAFDADLAALPEGRPLLATTYAANGLANGRDTLSAEAMRRAGLFLLADRIGHSGGKMALEELVMAGPELVVTGSRYATPSRAEAVLDHPALSALQAERLSVADRGWICGLPALTGTIRSLVR